MDTMVLQLVLKMFVNLKTEQQNLMFFMLKQML